jgi:MbtH protein
MFALRRLKKVGEESKMDNNEKAENISCKVVVNDEEQYSIWPVDQKNPLGWKDAGKRGSKQDCLDYIKTVWTDMRPLSLKKQLEGSSR